MPFAKKRNYRKRRVTRRKKTYKRPIRRRRNVRTRKNILDITSKKKRDTMVPAWWDEAESTFKAGSQVMTPSGGAIHRFLWPVTARTTTNFSSNPSKATRTNKNCYIRGFKEIHHLETATSMCWQWRRIVFSVKALSRHTTAAGQVAFNINNGYMRGTRPVPTGSFRDAIEAILFQGKSQIDWLTSMVAPIHTSGVTLHSDVTRNIQSRNSGGGYMKTIKIWTPINKNLIYNDTEDGPNMIPSQWSVDDKQGMGDLYVYDLFRPGLGAIAADVLDWRPNATLYWHER